MTIEDIKHILNAEVLSGEEWLGREVHAACGSDLMSDVLAYNKDQAVLLTGLCNPQVVRTAEMMDIICIVFVRGKKPDDATLSLAKSGHVVLLSTAHRMFDACGLLYQNSLRGNCPI